MDRPADNDADLGRLVDVLWGPPRTQTRGPKPTHTLAEVLDAAIGVADREGLRAISMQRVAAELGLTKMALYRYVPGRAELIALMTEGWRCPVLSTAMPPAKST